jgi:histidinol phosphatase-like enzyme
MLLQASREHSLDLASSIMIGDKSSDVKAAFSAGIKRVFWVTKDPECPGHGMPKVEVVESLLECARRVASKNA